MARQNTVGVVGQPISHSLSPFIHRVAFSMLGLDWQSEAREAGESQVDEVIDWLQRDEIRGCSVTMPLKSALVERMDSVSDEVKRLGALNCVVAKDGVLQGHSTDGAGFLAALDDELSVDLHGRSLGILGAGGAARAIALSAAHAGASEVLILARSEIHAEAVVLAIGSSIIRAAEAEEFADCDVVVNATPVGMEGTAAQDALSLISPGQLASHAVVCDLVYSPLSTPWLEACDLGGHRSMGGLSMLVHQALGQIELWTGQALPASGIIAELKRQIS